MHHPSTTPGIAKAARSQPRFKAQQAKRMQHTHTPFSPYLSVPSHHRGMQERVAIGIASVGVCTGAQQVLYHRRAGANHSLHHVTSLQHKPASK